MTLLNIDTQIMKIYFNFFHIFVYFRFKKRPHNWFGSKTILRCIMWQRLLGFISIFPSHHALTFIQEASC